MQQANLVGLKIATIGRTVIYFHLVVSSSANFRRVFLALPVARLILATLVKGAP